MSRSGIKLAKNASQIGSILRHWRKDAKLTQSAAADLIGVDTMTVSRWERGTIKGVKTDNIVGIGRAYGVPLPAVVSVLGATPTGELGAGVPRGTEGTSRAPSIISELVAARYGRAEHTPRIARLIELFAREAARLTDVDREIDHVVASLYSASAMDLIYVGDDGTPLTESGQDEQLRFLIAGIRAWLEARIAKRNPPERATIEANLVELPEPDSLAPAVRPSRASGSRRPGR
jgi:transcriptional regulator with XRE-family HTH domain